MGVPVRMGKSHARPARTSPRRFWRSTMPRPRSSPRATVSPRIQIPELSFALWILPREIDGFRELNTWKTTTKKYRSLPTCHPCSDLWKMNSCKRAPNSLLNRSKSPAYASSRNGPLLSCGSRGSLHKDPRLTLGPSRAKCWNWTLFFS